MKTSKTLDKRIRNQFWNEYKRSGSNLSFEKYLVKVLSKKN